MRGTWPAPRALSLSRSLAPWYGPEENLEARMSERRNAIKWNLDGKPDENVEEVGHRRHSDYTGTGGAETNEG